MECGIQVSSFRPVLKSSEEVKTAFQKMRDMGCSVVQLQWIDPAVPIGDIAAAMKEKQIVSVSVQEIYEAFLLNKAYYLDLMEATKSEWLCISRIPAERKCRGQFPLFLKELEQLIEELSDCGMKLCFHPVSADYEQDSTTYIDAMMEALPKMDLCLDLYHCLKCHIDVPGMLKRYAGRICMVHFKEGQMRQVMTEGGTKETEVLVPVGSGDTDWSEIIAACRETQVPYAFAEQESWEGDPFEDLGQGFRWLKENI